MLYETFNSIRESFGIDYFTSRFDDEVIQNLNPKFELREYQKEALGRFDFYFGGYQRRAFPVKKSDRYKVLVKVVDIFGNDTNKLLEVKIEGK